MFLKGLNVFVMRKLCKEYIQFFKVSLQLNGSEMKPQQEETVNAYGI